MSWLDAYLQLGTQGPPGPAGTLTPGSAAQIPITNAGATTVVMQTVSQDGEVSATGALSLHGATIPAAIPAPVVFGQNQAATAVHGNLMRVRSMHAGAGANDVGGDVSLVIGKKDGSTSNLAYIRFGEATVTTETGIVESTATGYIEYGRLSRNASGNVNLNMGGANSSFELSGQSPFSFATENTNTPTTGAYISVVPAGPASNGISINFHGQTYFITQPDGAQLLQLGASGTQMGPLGLNSAGISGFVSLDWGNSTVHQDLLTQRNASPATSDLPIITRWNGVLTFGSLAENRQTYALGQSVHRLLAPSGGHQFVHQNPVASGLVTDLNVVGDAQYTLVQGDLLTGTTDGRITQVYLQNTATTSAGTVIATIPIRTNAVTHLYARIEGKSGTDFASFLHEWTVFNNAGTVSIAPSQPAAIDKGHTSAAASIVPQFAVSGTNITITVTPWTATATHWTAYVESMVNMAPATAPASPTPPGSPSFYFSADLQGTATGVTTLTDQSGNGRNFTASGSGTLPNITAGSGPTASNNSLVLAASGRWYARADGLGLGSTNLTNLTLWAVVKYTVATNSQVIFQVGQSSGIWMAISQSLSGYRAFDVNPQGGGQINVSGGLATTNWEIQVVTIDASGNIYAIVNGKPQSVNPVRAVGVTASANSAIGANDASTGQVTGNLYSCGSYATAQDPMSVYAYLHALTGL